MSFLSPVTPEVLAALQPGQREELAVWSRNHGRVFDVRLHSIFTCPFLAYAPQYLLRRRHTGKWAAWLHGFYRRKHSEEGRCRCEDELGGKIQPKRLGEMTDRQPGTSTAADGS